MQLLDNKVRVATWPKPIPNFVWLLILIFILCWLHWILILVALLLLVLVELILGWVAIRPFILVKN